MNAQRSGDLISRLSQLGGLAVENIREYPDIGVRVIGFAAAWAVEAVWAAVAEWVKKTEDLGESYV